MRAILLGLLAVAGIVLIAPASVTPASAQLRIETPVGGVRVGPSQRRYRDYDQRRYRDYDRRRHASYGRYDRGCRTTIIQRSDGSVRRIRHCG